jgi:hypothetical protein
VGGIEVAGPTAAHQIRAAGEPAKEPIVNHTLTPGGHSAGWIITYGQLEPYERYDYVIGRVERHDGKRNVVERIDYRVWGPYDGRLFTPRSRIPLLQALQEHVTGAHGHSLTVVEHFVAPVPLAV